MLGFARLGSSIGFVRVAGGGEWHEASKHW